MMNRRSQSDKLSSRHPERIEFAREQRRQANEFVQDVWQMLRASKLRGKKFRREHSIPPYTVDFVCIELKLIVEIDGKHHQTEEGILHDKIRDQFLRQAGYEIVRINGYTVTQDQASVRKRIEDAVDQRVAH
jgi:very-short-patch-repair endonuclease